MSVEKWYDEYKKKKKKKEESPVLSWYNSYKGKSNNGDDVAPAVSSGRNHSGGGGSFAKGQTESKPTWFQSGAFSDGYQFGDVSKTILGTVTDASENITTAVADATENLIDTAAFGVGAVGGIFNKDFRDNVGDFISKEILQPTKAGEQITKYVNPVGWLNQWVNDGETEENSFLGDKADGLVQSAAHLVGSKALERVGVPSWLTMGVNAFGSEIESAFQQDATYLEAGISGAVSAVAEVVFEKISSGIKFKGGTLDDGFQKALTKNISDRITRTILKFATDLGGEGLEEVATEAVSAVGKKLTYMDEKEFNEIFSSEDAFDAFIGGVVMSGGMGGGNVVKSVANGTDYTSGLTVNEEKVVNKLYEDALADKRKNGIDLNKTQRDKLYDSIVEDMNNGQLKIDDIESVLGGDTYKAYQDVVKSEDAILKEYEELGKKQQPTLADQSRYSELKSKVDEIKTSSKKAQLKSQLSQEVFDLVQSDKTGRLAESYREVERRREAFTADLTKYKGKQREAIKRAIDSGVLNNTYRSHELVNILSKIESDKGIVFNYADNARLKESGFAVEGKTVNGFVDKSTGAVTLNIQSAKSWQSVVGHEITHVLEGTEAYDALQKALYAYAESKGELADRRGAITELYKGMNADIDSELTAELIGDYLFTDKVFVNHLTSDRNLFQKIYDEIKYLYKVATGKEHKEIAKVKKEFDKAWKELNVKSAESGQKNNTAENGGVSYKISEIPSKTEIEANYKAVANMESIVQLTGNEFAKGNVDLITQVTNYFDSIGGFVETPYGKVELTRSGVKSSIGHGIGRNKSIAFKAVPDVLAKGKIIDYQFNWKQRGYDTVVVAAPIKISDKEYFLAAIVNVEKDRNSYYLHEVALQEKKDTSVFKTGTTKNGTPSTEISSIHSLLKKLLDVKDNSSVNIDEESDGVSFSLSQPVEETKELIAIHNLSADKLMKSLRLGGLPMPSIAIMKAQDGHSKFGDISLVFKKDTIDPKLNKANKVYGGDAWTPVYPTLEYKVNDKKLGEIYHRVRGVKGVEFFNPVHFHPDNIENDINRWGGIEGVVEHYMDDYSLKNFYLAEQGRDVKMISSERTKSLTEQEVEEYDFIINALGRDVILEHASGKNWMAEHGEAYKSAVVDYYSSILPNMTLEEIQSIVEQKKPLEHWRDVHKIVNYLENGATKTEIVEDREATIKEINRRVNDEDYAKWLRDFYDGTVLKSGIRRSNVDPYTASGNRKSFEATHYEENLENVIKAMKEQAEVGNSAFFSGLGIWGAAAKAYKSIEEIKADEARLERLTDEEYSQIKTDFGNRLSEIAESIMNKRESNYFIALDNATECIIEAVRDSKTRSGLLKKLKSYTHLNVTETTVSDIVDLVRDISNMPTAYFEAKPQRAVGFDEVGVFVLPKGTDNNLKQELLSRGYSVAEYDSNIEDDRRQVVNHLEEYKFSITNKSDDIAPAGDFSTPLNELYYDDFAPIRSDVAPVRTATDTNVGGKSNVSDNDDIAPAVAENAITDAPIRDDVVFRGNGEEHNVTLDKKENDYSGAVQDIQEKLIKLEKERMHIYDSFKVKIANKQAELGNERFKDPYVEMEIEELIEDQKRIDTTYAMKIGKLKKMEKLAKAGMPPTRHYLYEKIIEDVSKGFERKGYNFDSVLGNAKKKGTLSTVGNTPQRVMEKTLGYKEGQILADFTVNKAAQNETEGIRWLNSFTDRKSGILAQLSKKYNIKPGSKESAAAQKYAEGFTFKPRFPKGEYHVYGDEELERDFPDAKVRNNIKGLASDPLIRQIYDETLDAINEARRRNAYPEIPRLDNYFLHFKAMEDVFSRLGIPFNINSLKAKDLPANLNGVTADNKPGKQYFTSELHRKGPGTSFDLLGGLERYLTAAKNQIYHIDDIQRLRAVRSHIAELAEEATKEDRRRDLYEEEKIEDWMEPYLNTHLASFAKFLHEEANVLAGKTSLIDRGFEFVIGRRGMALFNAVQRQVGSNMVGLNISSSLTNLLSVVQACAKSNKFDFTKAFVQTVTNKIKSLYGKGDSFAEDSSVIIRRKGAEQFYRKPYQKMTDSAFVFMSATDNISTEIIARTKYNELMRKGMDSHKAHFETDKWVSRLMGDRSLGQQPLLYDSKVLGVFTQFQLEVRNQLDSMFYDTIQEAKVSNEHIENALARNAKTAAKVTATIFQLMVAQHLFGKAFEAVAGYNPAFDIISVLATVFGFDDDEESEDTVLDNIGQGFLELLEDLPYTSVFTGGRVPMSSAIPYSEEGISEFISDVSEGEWKSICKEMMGLVLNVIFPVAGGQIKKTAQGLRMFKTDEEHPIAGSYTDKGNLRFPVEDTPMNRIQAGLFGQYANENAREYFDNGYAPLTEKQIQEYMDAELPIADYWKYREGLKGLNTNAEKADYINSLDIEDWQKNLLMNNILDRKDDVDMSDYNDYSGWEEFDFATKNPERYGFLKKNGISYDDYIASENSREAYNWASENPKGYAVSKAVTDDVVTYKRYTGDLNKIRADKDENGKSINGSKKEKVIEYINNLDMDYGSKLVLFKSKYPDDNSYNEEIINYINKREDLSYEERTAIFTELGFTVTDGNVYWE